MQQCCRAESNRVDQSASATKRSATKLSCAAPLHSAATAVSLWRHLCCHCVNSCCSLPLPLCHIASFGAFAHACLLPALPCPALPLVDCLLFCRVKTPGGNLVFQYRVKKANLPKCGDCHEDLSGVSQQANQCNNATMQQQSASNEATATDKSTT